MSREFKNQYFDGAGDISVAANARLVELLKEGLSHVSGIQQPGHPENEQQAKEDKEQYDRAEQRIEEIAADIYCALTGKEPK